jgi:hypothetical protein
VLESPVDLTRWVRASIAVAAVSATRPAIPPRRI